MASVLVRPADYLPCVRVTAARAQGEISGGASGVQPINWYDPQIAHLEQADLAARAQGGISGGEAETEPTHHNWTDQYNLKGSKLMKKTIRFIPLLLLICLLPGCLFRAKHADSFYDVNSAMDRRRIPLVKPLYMLQLSSPDDWYLSLRPGIYIEDPNGQDPYYLYSHLYKIEGIYVENGIILTYSPYVDENADSNIQENYYHWFVLIPDQEITKGFHSEEDFTEYIRTLGIQELAWLDPVKVYRHFNWTGCLDWIPDCEQK